MAGFEVAGYKAGGPQVIAIPTADTALAVGDLVNLESGSADLAATNDTGIIGVVLGTEDPTANIASMTANVTKVLVESNPQAIYAVTDNNARTIGAQLDLSGATGAQGVTTDSNHDFNVVATKNAAGDKTLVMLASGALSTNPFVA